MHHLWCCAETNRVSRGPNMEGCWYQLHSPSDTWPVFFWIWSCNLFLGHHFLLWFPSEHVDKYRFMKTFCDLIPFKFTYPSYHRYYLIHFNIIIYFKKRYILDSLACRYLGQYIIDSSSRDTSSYLYPFMYEHVISNLKSYSRFLFFCVSPYVSIWLWHWQNSISICCSVELRVTFISYLYHYFVYLIPSTYCKPCYNSREYYHDFIYVGICDFLLVG